MSDPLDVLEKSIADLRRAIRDASAVGDAERAGMLRAQLRRAERAWDTLIDVDPAPVAPAVEIPPRTGATGALLPAREHVHRALTLLRAPAAPKLIVNVHEAFFSGELPPTKLSSLRRDEERSYRSAPGARPYYLCPALAHDLLAPARALLTLSTWPLERRIIGPLSPRVDFLGSAIRVGEAVLAATPSTDNAGHLATRLLRRFATNIPNALPHSHGSRAQSDPLDPERVIDAAHAELEVHLDADHRTRVESATRARKQLRDDEQLFGTRLRRVGSEHQA
ncbi:hypothetical protein UO65_0056 [Actinokineospora spheciospongiae]|uniref:Uncharacterized protein n=1 Tax=Actinokineospora spheciospongiae TaxID=909613 RepID=W7JEP7_9PSEU|nr:hypothetical protein [Actinokineospora spheciospongiae]EWC64449.1 hypothetical protein UO65_0056 [Actinokineospora spheciospongiae]PWW60225.1 hypothetical protein DFQ13_10721 [Actinokineospora spheciospongiae]